MKKTIKAFAGLSLLFSSLALAAPDSDEHQKIYDALDVAERTSDAFITRPGSVKEKNIAELSCLHFNYEDNGEQKYLCTFDDPGDIFHLSNAYRDIYGALNVSPSVTRSPDTHEPRNPDIIMRTKQAGPISCRQRTQPPLEKIGYMCDLDQIPKL